MALAENPDLTLTGLYNLLEAIRAGDELTPRHAEQAHRARVAVSRDLHRAIDEAVAAAYGWPVDLAAAEVVRRLVALNAERASEEAAGRVRWLRPDFQPVRVRGGQGTAEMALPQAASRAEGAALRLVFPRDRYEQPLALVEALRRASGPVDVSTLSRAFTRGGARIEPRVTQVLTTLHRYGHVERLADGRYVARRAA